MKYIRTNLNEIYCLNDFTKSDIMIDCYVAKYFHRCINKNDIVATADTIEELCDEFVVIGYKIKDPFVFSKEGISIDDFWKHSPSDTIVYGAIWTEWGLKYVAKMNDEGELELL